MITDKLFLEAVEKSYDNCKDYHCQFEGAKSKEALKQIKKLRIDAIVNAAHAKIDDEGIVETIKIIPFIEEFKEFLNDVALFALNKGMHIGYKLHELEVQEVSGVGSAPDRAEELAREICKICAIGTYDDYTISRVASLLRREMGREWKENREKIEEETEERTKTE